MQTSIWINNKVLMYSTGCVCVLIAQSCPALCDPMDCSLSDSSVHGILQARILEWVAISFSRVSSWPRDWTWVSCIAHRFFTIWATRENPTRLLCPWGFSRQEHWSGLPCPPQLNYSKKKKNNNIFKQFSCTLIFVSNFFPYKQSQQRDDFMQ